MTIVRLSTLKSFASENFRSLPLLRQMILHERDAVDAAEFSTNVGLWLRLFEQEREARNK